MYVLYHVNLCPLILHIMPPIVNFQRALSRQQRGATENPLWPTLGAGRPEAWACVLVWGYRGPSVGPDKLEVAINIRRAVSY